MPAKPTTVQEYLASLPADRRADLEALRKLIRKNLDKSYEECLLYGIISYVVPHRVWPLGYHCDPTKPIMMAAIANRTNNFTVYLMSVYMDKSERAWFESAWSKAGKKLSMGGCCVRFRKLEDAALDVIGEAIRRTPATKYIEGYVKALASTGRGPDGKKLSKPSTKGTGAKHSAESTKSISRTKFAKKTAKKAVKKVTKKAVKPAAKKSIKKSSKRN
jgi:hypothetical protein